MGSTDSTHINSVGVGVIGLGLVIGWAGIRNQSLVTAFRDLAMGKSPTPNPKPAWTDIQLPNPFTAGGDAAGGGAAGSASGAEIVAIAAGFKGQCYGFGAGHGGTPCKSRCTDCSSYVSCVLYKAGALRGGTLTTSGLAKFGAPVAFEQRAPGDVLVWNGGAGGGHCGIVVNGSTMWHNACTGCGGVQLGRYGKTRTGRPTVVRRAQSVRV